MWSMPWEFESPDTYFLLLHAGLVILVGLVLSIPTILRKSGFFKSYFDRRKDTGMYEPLATDEEDWLRIAEMEMGSHNLVWGVATLGALFAGGDAQLLCFLQLPAMASLVFYFYKMKQMLCVAASTIVLVVCGYFGLQPWPPPLVAVEWTPSAIFLAMHSALLLIVGIVFIAGKTDAAYEANPLSKKFMNREREILVGTTLLGGGLGAVGAICSNGAVNFCTFVAPVFFVTGYVHWIGLGDRQNAINNYVVMVLYGCAGLLPRIL